MIFLIAWQAGSFWYELLDRQADDKKLLLQLGRTYHWNEK